MSNVAQLVVAIAHAGEQPQRRVQNLMCQHEGKLCKRQLIPKLTVEANVPLGIHASRRDSRILSHRDSGLHEDISQEWDALGKHKTSGTDTRLKSVHHNLHTTITHFKREFGPKSTKG